MAAGGRPERQPAWPGAGLGLRRRTTFGVEAVDRLIVTRGQPKPVAAALTLVISARDA